MALQKTINFKGITVGDAYLKIQSFNGSKELLKFDLATHSKAGEQALAVTSARIRWRNRLLNQSPSGFLGQTRRASCLRKLNLLTASK
jgi:hypothetical protein